MKGVITLVLAIVLPLSACHRNTALANDREARSIPRQAPDPPYIGVMSWLSGLPDEMFQHALKFGAHREFHAVLGMNHQCAALAHHSGNGSAPHPERAMYPEALLLCHGFDCIGKSRQDHVMTAA